MINPVQWLRGWRLTRKQFKIDKHWRQNTQRAYTIIFDGSIEANTVLADLCRAHNVFGPSFDPDPYENARMAGERIVILRILNILNMPPGKVAELIEEGFNELPMDAPTTEMV